jgi:hypothetical protein
MVNEPDPMKISDNSAALRKIPKSEADLNEDFPSAMRDLLVQEKL